VQAGPRERLAAAILRAKIASSRLEALRQALSRARADVLCASEAVVTAEAGQDTARREAKLAGEVVSALLSELGEGRPDGAIARAAFATGKVDAALAEVISAAPALGGLAEAFDLGFARLVIGSTTNKAPRARAREIHRE
jgi:hypothetical protein